VRDVKDKNVFSLLTSLYIGLLMTVFLFYSGSQGYQNLVSAKFTAFCIISGGYIILMSLIAAESVVIGAEKLKSPLNVVMDMSWTQRLAVGYIFVTWISAMGSPYFPETVLGVSRYEGALSITIYGLLFLLVSKYGRITKRLLYILGASVSAFCILCILQFFGKNPLGLYPMGYTYADAYIAYAGAYLGTIGNVDLVAAFLCLVIPMIWIALVRLQQTEKYLLIIPLVLSLYVLIRMWVLAGIIGVLMGCVLMMPIILSNDSRKSKVISGIVLALIIGGVVGIYLTDFGGGLLYEIHEILHGNMDSTFGSGRLHIWMNTLGEIPNHILWGTGPDTMLYAGIEPFERYHEAADKLIVTQIDVAHNEYLNILFHQGVAGLIIYGAFLLSLAKLWVGKSKDDIQVAILGGAAFCYCIQAFFGFSMCITAPFFWVTLALLEQRRNER